MSACTYRKGETNIANNGMQMTIIEYRNCKDIDIEFEDKQVVYHKCYSDFIKGRIAHPFDTYEYKKDERLKEEVVAKNGLKMKIIKYHNRRVVDIEFEDGTIVYNKPYKCFKKGTIRHPKYKISNEPVYLEPLKNRKNEKGINNSGMPMTIIEYKNCENMKVQMANGVIKENKSYYDFTHGKIASV